MKLFKAALGGGKGMVQREQTLVFLIPFEHWKINHPKWRPSAFRMPVFMTNLEPECAHRFIDDFGLVGTKKYQIAGLGADPIEDFKDRIAWDKFDNG